MLRDTHLEALEEERSQSSDRRVWSLLMAMVLVVGILTFVGTIGSNEKSVRVGFHAQTNDATGDVKLANDNRNCNEICQFTGEKEHAKCMKDCSAAPKGANMCDECKKDCKTQAPPTVNCTYYCIEEGICNTKQPKNFVDDIVQGTQTSSWTYPFIVSLQFRGSHNCGGTLISARSVLTAAHCVSGVSANDLRVVLGETRRLSHDANQQTINVERITIHPDWNPIKVGVRSRIQGDVAVLTLRDNANCAAGNIGFVSLAVHGAAMPAVGSRVTVVGWGRTSAGAAIPDHLLQANMQIASDANCKTRSWDLLWHDSMICAESPHDLQDICNGDSGGPMIQNGVQIGITSWTYSCGAHGHPSMFMEVSWYRHWIDQQKVGPKPPPAPSGGGGGCVSTHSWIRVKDTLGGVPSVRKVEDVSVGDYIETRNGYEMVWLVFPYGVESTISQEMIELKVEHAGEIKRVVLTREHLILDGETDQLRRADELKTGDKVRMYVDKQDSVGSVVDLSTEWAPGTSLVTYSGEFVLANGVAVSSYSHSSMFAKVVHALSLPFRLMSLFVEPTTGKMVLEFLRIPEAVRPGSVFASLFV